MRRRRRFGLGLGHQQGFGSWAGAGFVVGGSAAFTPAALSPHAWYDAHLGGSSTQITDSSGNGRAALTNGATTAAALWLPYTVPSVHLEAAGVGTNSISCTAPVGTASYSAEPRDGGAATTGVATDGAFAFTADGDWQSISLLDGAAAEVARFDASLSSQTGHTDSYGVVWAVNRGTAGRKAVVQSPAAQSDRGLFLIGSDLMTVPASALPNVDDPVSVVFVFRRWHLPLAQNYMVWSTKLAMSQSSIGIGFRTAGTVANTTISYIAADGTTSDVASVSFAFGTRGVVYTESGPAPRAAAARVNAAAEQVDSGKSTTTTLVSGRDLVIGNVASVFMDLEFEAILLFDRVLTTDEHDLLVTYYRGGT